MSALYAAKQQMEDQIETGQENCKYYEENVLEYVEAYKILGIEFGRSLTTDAFKAIYKPLLRKAHPDKNVTNIAQATEDTKILNNAVKFVTDDDYRIINNGKIAEDSKKDFEDAVEFIKTKQAALADIGVQRLCTK